jgi:hypothetical protein
MTPKEKATELFEYYFYKLQCHFSAVGDEIAKECALIAVDEIIRELTEEISPSVHGFRHQYWIEVEHEIQKL